MSVLERLRRALASDYDIEGPLAEGGMGMVFRARDRHLERDIALKILRPEQATAAGGERFLREARTLAGFRHPHIVTVHRAGETDGIAWYAMDLLAGETLADRLSRGPLPPAEALAIADQLLAALEAVHARGIVHRDIKPANIFLTGDSAVLGDFGIAKSLDGATTQLTEQGHAVGTPGYMPPEQGTGGDVTPQTDLCALGMTVYHALTGRPWTMDDWVGRPDWTGVPPRVVPVLRRALAFDPRQRTASARELRHALARARGPARAWSGLAIGVVGVALLVALWQLVLPRFQRPAGQPLRLNVRALSVEGASPALGDSIADELVASLRAAPDLAVRRVTAAAGLGGTGGIDVSGHVAAHGDTLTADLHGAGGGRVPLSLHVAVRASRASVADSLAAQLLLEVYTDPRSADASQMPIRALPRTAAGLAAWKEAERRYSRAQWDAADTAYRLALALDSTCTLCDLRLQDVTRWVRKDQDPARVTRLLAHTDEFPPVYALLLHASVDTTDRWGAVERLARDAPDFALGQFLAADELFHRGPLAGRSRRDALPMMRRAAALQPAYAPTWEHLAWALIAEGDRPAAESALGRYTQTRAADDYTTMVFGALLQAAFAWRFEGNGRGAAVSSTGLGNPAIGSYPGLGVGPRYLMTFDTPAGVVWLGEQFVAWPGRTDLVVPGLVAEIVGLTALGRPTEARAAAARLRRQSADAALALAGADLETALVRFDSAADVVAELDSTLVPLLEPGAGADAGQQRRAAWLLTLAHRAVGQAVAAHAYRMRVRGEAAPAPLATLLDADSIAAARGVVGARAALAMTQPLLRLDSAGRAGEPLFRAALHLLRGEWYAATGNRLAAVRELRWHENSDIQGHPTTIVESVDYDWALGTLGRWRRAQLIDAGPLGREEACRAYADVVRLWQGGEARYAARARQAQARLAAPGCHPS